jgi:hypothetical protein
MDTLNKELQGTDKLTADMFDSIKVFSYTLKIQRIFVISQNKLQKAVTQAILF